MRLSPLLAGTLICAGLTGCTIPGWETAEEPEAMPAGPVQAAGSGDFRTPVGEELVLRGMFNWLAEIAVFRDCRSRQFWPVAEDEAYPVLKKVYMDVRLTEGDPLLVRLRGRVDERAPNPQAPPRESLVVLEFLGARPGASCEGPVRQAAD